MGKTDNGNTLKEICSIGHTNYDKYEIEEQANFTIYVPKVNKYFISNLVMISL